MISICDDVYVHITFGDCKKRLCICRCGLILFYRHTNKDEKVTFIFPDMLVQSGEKPVTTEKPEVLDEAAVKKKRKKVGS